MDKQDVGPSEAEIQEALECCKNFMTCQHVLAGKITGQHPQKLATAYEREKEQRLEAERLEKETAHKCGFNLRAWLREKARSEKAEDERDLLKAKIATLRKVLERCTQTLAHQPVCGCEDRGWGQHEALCDDLDKIGEMAKEVLAETQEEKSFKVEDALACECPIPHGPPYDVCAKWKKDKK